MPFIFFLLGPVFQPTVETPFEGLLPPLSPLPCPFTWAFIPQHTVPHTTCNLKKIVVLDTRSSPTLCDPMDCSPPDSSLRGILQARILEWVAISFSRTSSQARDQTRLSCTVGRVFTYWVTREALSTTPSLFLSFQPGMSSSDLIPVPRGSFSWIFLNPHPSKNISCPIQSTSLLPRATAQSPERLASPQTPLIRVRAPATL